MPKYYISLFLVAAMVMSCASLQRSSSVEQTQIRQWTESQKDEPSSRIAIPSQVGMRIVGRLEQFSLCRDLTREENSRIRKHTNTSDRLWLELLIGSATAALGTYLLATASSRSNEPGENDEGNETWSPQKNSYVYGGISAGIGGIMLGHSTYLGIGAIDREEQLDNSIELIDESNPYDCDVVGIADVPIRISSEVLGIQNSVEVSRTDHDGKFEFKLTDVEGFVFPGKILNTATLYIQAGTVNGDVEVGDWLYKPLKIARASCREFDSCASKYSALKKKNEHTDVKIAAYVRKRILELAQESDQSCRKFEKHFSGKSEFGKVDDTKDTCDFFAVRKQGTLVSVKRFLKKKRSKETIANAENLAVDLISQNPNRKDCKWFKEQFPRSPYLHEINDLLLSFEFNGVPASLLKCCGRGNMKVAHVIRNEKKSWSTSLAVETIIQSNSSFKAFTAQEIEHLRRVGVRDAVIEAMMKKAGQVKERESDRTREASYQRRENARTAGEIKRCVVSCERDYGACTDRRDPSWVDNLVYDTTGCKQQAKRCIAACQE